jgi:hypothetical protein
MSSRLLDRHVVTDSLRAISILLAIAVVALVIAGSGLLLLRWFFLQAV